MTKRDRKRFWSKVKIDLTTGCWVWTASIRTWKKESWDGGYGAFKIYGRVERAHKVAYKIIFGVWPGRGKVLLHGCDNRRCVNVLEHIQPGTQIENVKDMLTKGRSIHQKRKGTILQGEAHAETGVQAESGGSQIEPRPGQNGDLQGSPPPAPPRQGPHRQRHLRATWS